MRVDWEGEVYGFYVNADYHMDYDDSGNTAVQIEQYQVFNQLGQKLSADVLPGYPTEEEIAEAIEQEQDDAA